MPSLPAMLPAQQSTSPRPRQWAALGYGVDVWQHTSPWGLLVGLLIGTAAGTRMMLQEEARRANANKQQAPKNDND